MTKKGNKFRHLIGSKSFNDLVVMQKEADAFQRPTDAMNKSLKIFQEINTLKNKKKNALKEPNEGL